MYKRQPVGCYFMSQLGRKYGVPTPIIDSCLLYTSARRQAEIALVPLPGVPRCLFVQLLGLLREGELQGGIAVLPQQELLEVAGGGRRCV